MLTSSVNKHWQELAGMVAAEVIQREPLIASTLKIARLDVRRAGVRGERKRRRDAGLHTA
jgi:hypothetical protein